MFDKIPKHIAVIMDGNGRWAQKLGMTRIKGHRQGVESLRNLVTMCIESSISVLTVYAFSSENWRRPIVEVKALMELLTTVLKDKLDELHSNDIKLNIIGNKEGLNKKLQSAINNAEKITMDNTKLVLNIALNYGGRDDIVNAVKNISKKVVAGKLILDDINEDLVSKEIALSDLPTPDLLIRTGGEQRLSNFLLWQMAYSELFFTNTLWPEFKKQDFLAALDFYNNRERRFGMIGEQVKHLYA